VYPNGNNSANAINDALMVAGSASGSMRVPVIWYRRATGTWVALPLGVPGSDNWGDANDISEPDAVGRVRVTGYTDYGVPGERVRTAPHAVRWTLGTDASGAWQVISIEALPSPTTRSYPGAWGVALNSAGDAVGIANGYIMEGSPAKWPVGGGYDPLPVLAGSSFGRAVSINSQGWVVGAVWDKANQCDRAAIWRQR
jgi:hypothetical protein